MRACPPRTGYRFVRRYRLRSLKCYMSLNHGSLPENVLCQSLEPKLSRVETRVNISQRESTPETRRDGPRAPHELAKRDALIRSTTNTRHHFKNAPFLFYLFGSSRANTSVDGVARAPSISRGETTRRPSRRGHTNLDHARDATERIDARTHDAFGAFTLHVKITSRR